MEEFQLALLYVMIVMAFVASVRTSYATNVMMATKRAGLFFGLTEFIIASTCQSLASILLIIMLASKTITQVECLSWFLLTTLSDYELITYCFKCYTDNRKVTKVLNTLAPMIGISFICITVSFIDETCFVPFSLDDTKSTIRVICSGTGFEMSKLYRIISGVFLVAMFIPIIVCLFSKFKVIYKEAFSLILMTFIVASFKFTCTICSGDCEWTQVHMLESYLMFIMYTFVFFKYRIFNPRQILMEHGTGVNLSKEAKHEW